MSGDSALNGGTNGVNNAGGMNGGSKGTFRVKAGLAQMLKGGVIMGKIVVVEGRHDPLTIREEGLS